jgi:DNA-binding transcriptional LysR family regulator
MDRYAAMLAFVRVVEAGSFARGAQRLRVSTSSASRLVAELEQHLGARLLNRTTRKLSLTEGGQAFYERCVQLLAELDEAEKLAGAAATSPAGTLRLTCPHNIAAGRVAPAIAGFVAKHPRMRFDVTVSDHNVDLVEEGYDLAIRIGGVGAERLVARKLGGVPLVLAAAPAYLQAHGRPQQPADLATHRALTYAYSPAPRLWRLRDASGGDHEVRIDGPLHANSGELLAAAAASGLGIVFEPEFTLAAALASGTLERVLPSHSAPQLDIWAVYPSRRHLSAKVRLFVDHLIDCFAADGVRPAST